jgi:hypothetical protein
VEAIVKILRIALVNKYGWQDVKSNQIINQIIPSDEFNLG